MDERTTLIVIVSCIPVWWVRWWWYTYLPTSLAACFQSHSGCVCKLVYVSEQLFSLPTTTADRRLLLLAVESEGNSVRTQSRISFRGQSSFLTAVSSLLAALAALAAAPRGCMWSLQATHSDHIQSTGRRKKCLKQWIERWSFFA